MVVIEHATRLNKRRTQTESAAFPDDAMESIQSAIEAVPASVFDGSTKHTEVGGFDAAISRRLGEAVADGKDVTSAVVEVFEELQTAPGQIVPIGKLEDVDRNEVSIEERLEVLWESDLPAIAQVGLLADESGKTKVTIWEKADAPWTEEGERVRIHGAARNWYEGRVSLAVTGWSTIHFPERDCWWE